MDKDIKDIPICAINPLLGILNIDWFLSLLGNLLNDNFNIFVIHNADYKHIKKRYGILAAKFSKRKMVNRIMKIEGIDLIGDYDGSSIIVVSKKNLTFEFLNINKEEDFRISIGETASLISDNAFSIVNRALMALNLSHSKENKYQLL